MGVMSSFSMAKSTITLNYANNYPHFTGEAHPTLKPCLPALSAGVLNVPYNAVSACLPSPYGTGNNNNSPSPVTAWVKNLSITAGRAILSYLAQNSKPSKHIQTVKLRSAAQHSRYCCATTTSLSPTPSTKVFTNSRPALT